MMKRGLVALGLLVGALAARPAAAAYGDKVPFDMWLPSGFEFHLQASPQAGVEATRFVGRQRKDGTRPVLVVTTVRLPEDPQKRDDEGLRDMLVEKHIKELQAKYQVEDYTRTLKKVGDLSAVKLTWENGFGQPPRTMKVTLVVAVVKRVAIIMRAEDLGEKRQQGMASMEQAMYSFTLTHR
jgi:hypothetical protein